MTCSSAGTGLETGAGRSWGGIARGGICAGRGGGGGGWALCEAISVLASLSLFYFNSTSNRTVFERCECGLYGFNSPYIGAQGVVGIPVSDPYACDRNTAFTVMEAPWIALIERGNCSFAEKIQVATRRGAAAAVIYNSRGRGNNTLLMAHQGE
uniref:PA domain-containing protein n=1 Tax=Geospiza parvula TaxID=87175 RepID=A0A8C3QD60_GEOPR